MHFVHHEEEDKEEEEEEERGGAWSLLMADFQPKIDLR